jgi:hypothetical protein
MTATNEQKLQCAERELRFRQRVFPRLVERGKMTQQQSERELELMQAIADDYRVLAQAELLI